MLLTELILSKRGPLGKVWLSAHQERKLSKAQTLGIDVEESVEAILEQDEGPTTLRISGQLMLGVTRIYSRKVQYLLDDCKETRERIALAFRPGMVDLPEDQARASRNAITFSDVRNDFDYFDWSWAAPPPELSAASASAPSGLNLRPATKEFGAYNFGRPAVASIYGGSSVSRHPSQDDTSSHLDSQDFSGIDLNLNFDDIDAGGVADADVEKRDRDDDDMSVEMGRRAVRAESLGSGRSEIRADSLGLGKGGNDEFEGEMDLGLDFDAFVDQPSGLDRRREGSVASSVLSPPPELLSAGDVTLTEITPRTAARIAQLGPTQATVASAGDLLDPSAPADGRKAKRVRLIRADADIELPDAYFAHPGPDAPVWAAEAHFIPSDPADVALQTLFANPGDYFLPVTDAPQGQGGGKVLYAGPIGLADELKELFTFPVNLLRRDREDEGDAALGPNKRQKVQGQDEPEEEQQGQGENDDEDVEIARRQSVLAPELLDNEGYPGAEGMDDSFALADDPLAFDIPQTPRKAPTERYPSLAPSRAESMARQIQYSGDQGEFALAMFDNRTSAGAAGASDSLQSQSQQQTPTKSSVAASEARTHGGYSKNTGMAMGLLRRELEVIEAEVQAEEKVVRMNELADKASKRAASTFFFELLVLGTRDCVKLEQKDAFGDIEVRAKERLFQEISV